MTGEVDQRPSLPCPGLRLAAQKPRGVNEQERPPPLRVEGKLVRGQRLRGEQDVPSLDHFGQLGAAHAFGKQLRGHPLQDGLRRRTLTIELFERFPPPGKLDAADHRLAPTGEDRAQSYVKPPQGFQRGPPGGRHIAQDKGAVRIEVRRHDANSAIADLLRRLDDAGRH